MAGIKQDLEKRNVSDTVINVICDLVNIVTEDPFETLNKIQGYLADSNSALEGIQELREILTYIPSKVLSKVKIDFTLARGADYYTGFIIESVINNIELGAVLGGGRFDNLVEAFCDERVPAVGMAFGLERIITAMKELELTDKLEIYPKKVIILDNSELQYDIIKCSSILRERFDVSILYGVYEDKLLYKNETTYKGGIVIQFINTNTVSIKTRSNTNYAMDVKNMLISYGYEVL